MIAVVCVADEVISFPLSIFNDVTRTLDHSTWYCDAFQSASVTIAYGENTFLPSVMLGKNGITVLDNNLTFYNEHSLIYNYASNWGWRHREPFYLPCHEPALVIEWQGHTCSFLLGTKPLWHWRKWKSGPTSKRDPRPRHRPTGKCPLYRYETTGQLLHSEVGSNQVGFICAWQRSLSCETNTGATEEVPAPNQSWMTICCWSVHCYRNVVMNTTQSTR